MKLLGSKDLTAPLPPAIVKVVPSEIDLSIPADRQPTLHIYGYDFDVQDSSKNFMQPAIIDGTDNATALVPRESVARVSHYHLTVGVDAIERLAKPLTRPKFVMMWNGKPMVDQGNGERDGTDNV